MMAIGLIACLRGLPCGAEVSSSSFSYKLWRFESLSARIVLATNVTVLRIQPFHPALKRSHDRKNRIAHL